MKAPTNVVPGKADAEQIFLMFAAFGGDIFRTAHACGVSPEEVTVKAEEGKWMERIRALIELKKGEKGVDVERGVNRAWNFVQVNRYRFIVDQLVRGMEEKSFDELIEMCRTYTRGKDNAQVPCSLSFKIFADLANAMEKVHWMTYQATLDLPQDRAHRRELGTGDGAAEEDTHAKIAKALTGMMHPTPAESLAKGTQNQVESIQANLQRQRAAASPPEPPDTSAPAEAIT
jgi:hypothetical protein